VVQAFQLAKGNFVKPQGLEEGSRLLHPGRERIVRSLSAESSSVASQNMLLKTCFSSTTLIQNLYRSEFGLLQFSTEDGQMLGVAIAADGVWAVFDSVHLLSISYRKLVIFGERIEAGETG